MRDNQRSKVYELDSLIEEFISQQQPFTKPEMRRELKRLNAAFGGNCKLVWRRGGRYSFYRRSTNTIHIAPMQRKIEVLLHEYAHYLCDAEDAETGNHYRQSHGAEFVQKLMMLCSTFANVPIDWMIEKAEALGVDWRILGKR